MKRKKWLLLFLLIALGTSLLSLTMVRSGLNYSFGMGFWGPSGHDGVWHLSLMNQTAKEIPPANPVFSGEKLTNYHWGFDWFASIIGKIFHLSFVNVYFRFLPIVFALLIGILSFLLATEITGKFWLGFWFAFFNYFAGSFGWIVTLIKDGKIGGESLFWSMQSISTLINPPYAFSLVILLLGLWLWQKKRTEKSFIWPAIIGLIFGLSTLVKVYAGVLVGLSLLFFWLLKDRKVKSFNFLVLLVTGLVSAASLGAMGVLGGHSSMLVFKPFWFVHSLVESLDKLYLPKLAILRINLASQWLSLKLPFLVGLELLLLLIFVLGNLGVRVFGFWPIFKKARERKLKDLDWFLLFYLFFSFLFPLLFIQKGTTWNTIQFFYYFLFVMNFYLATFLVDLSEKFNLKKKIVFVLIILMVLPTSFSTLKDYFGYPPPAAIPYYELQGLTLLKVQAGSNVLTFPYDRYKKNGLETPIPLYLYETTAYVSAFSGKQTFLEDEMNLEIIGSDWRKRRSEAEKFFDSKDSIWARGFLLNNGIDYIYLVNDQGFNLQEADLGIKMIFNNGQVRIYKVLK